MKRLLIAIVLALGGLGCASERTEPTPIEYELVGYYTGTIVTTTRSDGVVRSTLPATTAVILWGEGRVMMDFGPLCSPVFRVTPACEYGYACGTLERDINCYDSGSNTTGHFTRALAVFDGVDRMVLSADVDVTSVDTGTVVAFTQSFDGRK